MNQNDIETATKYHYDSDYGLVTCVVLGVGSDGVARIMLLDDTPPLGDQGDVSFVESDDIHPRG